MRADVDEVELLEFEPVDRNHRVGSFISSRKWMPRSPPTSPSPASTIGKPRASTLVQVPTRRRGRTPSSRPKRRRAPPRHEDRDRCFGPREVEHAAAPYGSRRPPRRLSMVSPSSGKSGAMTGTIAQRQHIQRGDTKIVLPLTWVVYCDAPITVARMPCAGGSRRAPQAATRRGSPRRAGRRGRRRLRSPSHRRIRRRRRKT